MALPLYLAMTAAEMGANFTFPPFFAYMACHFSPGGPGLSNYPGSLPPGAMLTLDDSTPMSGHDPERILNELSALVERHQCECVLLDFQRPGIAQQQELAALLSSALPCPVGVAEVYGAGLSCPVFLPPAPPDKPLSAYLAPWQGREIWLDAALDGTTLTLTEQGCTASPLFDFPEDGQRDTQLHCHYTIQTDTNAATFHLWRTREDLDDLLMEAHTLGITKSVGLWQELGE